MNVMIAALLFFTPPSPHHLFGGAFYCVLPAGVAGAAFASFLPPQLIRTVLSDPRDEATRLYLVYANKGAGDVLLREELEELARLHAGRLEVIYKRVNISKRAHSPEIIVAWVELSSYLVFSLACIAAWRFTTA